jgi:hypothetical protein
MVGEFSASGVRSNAARFLHRTYLDSGFRTSTRVLMWPERTRRSGHRVISLGRVRTAQLQPSPTTAQRRRSVRARESRAPLFCGASFVSPTGTRGTRYNDRVGSESRTIEPQERCRRRRAGRGEGRRGGGSGVRRQSVLTMSSGFQVWSKYVSRGP